VVFKVLGIALKRDAYEQAGQGNLVDFVDLAKEGDLAFFENEAGKIVHVGIVLKEQKIIHASGKVRIDKLDHYGIFNSDIKKYSHKLKFIKRLF
jgi:cell wall-associated NlpC family hydrolase